VVALPALLTPHGVREGKESSKRRKDIRKILVKVDNVEARI
jgi:uncharacterized protein with GYD domain